MTRRWTRAAAAVPAIALLLGIAAAPSPAAAQDVNNPEELKRLHGEAIVQLKAAQDRKNELAEENEKLKARIGELERQLSEREKECAGWAERTWFYRSQYAAWDRFLDRYPRLREQWRAFLAEDELDPVNPMPILPAQPAVSRAG